MRDSIAYYSANFGQVVLLILDYRGLDSLNF